MLRKSTQPALLAGVLGLSAFYCLRYILRLRKADKEIDSCDRLERVLDMHESLPQLLSECLEDDLNINMLPTRPRPPTAGWEVQPAGEQTGNDETPRVDELWSYDRTRVELTDYRKVVPQLQDSAINLVLCEIKNRHGVMVRNEANIRILRIMAKNIMTKHRIRPAHIAKLMPMIEVLGFEDSIHHIRAKRDYRNFKRWERSWYRWWFYGKWRE